MGGAVPAIAAVHQHVLALKQTAHHVIRPLDYQKHVVVPLRLGEVHVEPRVFTEGGLQGLVVGLPNSVDVGDIEELHLAIRIKLLGLIPLACYFITEGCHLIPCIKNDTIGGTLRLIYITNTLTLWISLGIADESEHELILRRSAVADSYFALTGTIDAHKLIAVIQFIEIGECGHPASASELRAPYQAIIGYAGRNDDLFWVGGADLAVSIV